MQLKEVQIYNRAPFDDLLLNFNDGNIFVLSGINGAGKTTIISYIVDAFHEIAKKGFPNEFENIENKYYRISSSLSIMDSNKESFVYLRFLDGENIIDYIDIRNLLTEEQYNTAVRICNPIKYADIKREFASQNVVKHFTLTERQQAEKIFSENLLTYFPAYRYEKPAYLNDPYTISLSFKTDSGFTGYLENPIEVTSDLPTVANWIMDIVLDSELYKGTAQKTLLQLNRIFSALLKEKIKAPVRLGIGPRQIGGTRIQIVKTADITQVYPSIFNMSSGEHALICLFCEIARQADNLGIAFDAVNGIVLVDEIDKHLHIKLQKEILPDLLKLFPNVQFIVTSHSPFFNLGLASKTDISYKIFDLDNGGINCAPNSNDLFREVYDMMITENEHYAHKYQGLLDEVESSTVPLLITEGKTDWKHLKAAQKALGLSSTHFEYYEYENTMGDTTLLNLLKQLAIVSPNRKIIGMFDRDKDDICKEVTSETCNYVLLSKNIYAFAIPVVNETVYGAHTSIEHYYPKVFLLKENSDGRRLFLGSEFYESGISKCRNYHTKFSGIQNKVKINGVIDEKVYSITDDPEEAKSLALSKSAFAKMILDEEPFANDADFTEFSKIFDVISEITAL